MADRCAPADGPETTTREVSTPIPFRNTIYRKWGKVARLGYVEYMIQSTGQTVISQAMKMDGRLKHASIAYDSPAGLWKTRWRIGENGEAEPEEIEIEAGEQVFVTVEETEGRVSFEKKKLAEEEVPAFLVESLRKDTEQLEKVYEETGWEAEKLFPDGAPALQSDLVNEVMDYYQKIIREAARYNFFDFGEGVKEPSLDFQIGSVLDAIELGSLDVEIFQLVFGVLLDIDFHKLIVQPFEAIGFRLGRLGLNAIGGVIPADQLEHIVFRGTHTPRGFGKLLGHRNDLLFGVDGEVQGSNGGRISGSSHLDYPFWRWSPPDFLFLFSSFLMA